MTIKEIIKKENLDLNNKNYIVYFDKIRGGDEYLMPKEYCVQDAKTLHSDSLFLAKMYRQSFFLSSTSNIDELETKLQENREWYAHQIYLKDLRMLPLRRYSGLEEFISKIEKIIKDNNLELNDEFLTWGYGSFYDQENMIVNFKTVMEIVNKINSFYDFDVERQKETRILAFMILMKAIRANEEMPKEREYRLVYDEYVQNIPLGGVRTELINFHLYEKSEERGLKKEFFFDGQKKEFEIKDIIFGMDSRNNVYVKNVNRIDAETADFEYFFIGDDGFIRKIGENNSDYKHFKAGDEVVKSKLYDSFETVDHYTL